MRNSWGSLSPRCPPLSEGPHGESTVKGETSTLCKERESGGHRPDTDRRQGAH